MVGGWTFAMAASIGGCGASAAALCDRLCECVGCSESERADCIDSLDDAAKSADEKGCGGSYDDYVSCVDQELECKNDAIVVDGCDGEIVALADCTGGTIPGVTDPCIRLCQDFNACDGSQQSDCSGSSTQCTDAQKVCAQCFLDDGRDVCTELLDIASDCSAACGG
jgi:hypothetical protein